MAQYLARPAGIYHWQDLLQVLSWSPVGPFLVFLGFDSADDDVMERAARAVSRIDEALGPQDRRREMSPSEFGIVSEEALRRALDEFTPTQARVVVRIGKRSHDESTRAFIWLVALGRVVKNIGAIPRVVSPEHVGELNELDEDRRAQRDWEKVADQLDANDEQESNLAALLRMVWFDRFWIQFVRWPASEREALIEFAGAQLPSQGVAYRLREPHAPPDLDEV